MKDLEIDKIQQGIYLLEMESGMQKTCGTKLVKKVNLGRYAGPFLNIPFKNYVQSPVGLVPKAGNKTRLIFHLSYDFKFHR